MSNDKFEFYRKGFFDKPKIYFNLPKLNELAKNKKFIKKENLKELKESNIYPRDIKRQGDLYVYFIQKLTDDNFDEFNSIINAEDVGNTILSFFTYDGDDVQIKIDLQFFLDQLINQNEENYFDRYTFNPTIRPNISGTRKTDGYVMRFMDTPNYIETKVDKHEKKLKDEKEKIKTWFANDFVDIFKIVKAYTFDSNKLNNALIARNYTNLVKVSKRLNKKYCPDYHTPNNYILYIYVIMKINDNTLDETNEVFKRVISYLHSNDNYIKPHLEELLLAIVNLDFVILQLNGDKKFPEDLMQTLRTYYNANTLKDFKKKFAINWVETQLDKLNNNNEIIGEDKTRFEDYKKQNEYELDDKKLYERNRVLSEIYLKISNKKGGKRREGDLNKLSGVDKNGGKRRKSRRNRKSKKTRKSRKNRRIRKYDSN